MGLVASSLASLPLVLAWGSFWSTLTFGLEAVFIGLLCKNKRSNIVLTVIAYWLFIGMPISWYSISQYEDFLDSHRTTILIKQLANGILYAHLAALLLPLSPVSRFFSLAGKIRARSIKEQSSHLISSLLITLGILFFFYTLNQNFNNFSEKFAQSHIAKHNSLEYQLSLIMEDNQKAIAELKYTLARVWEDKQQRGEVLLDFNSRNPSFKTMVVANKSGDLINSSPPELVQNVLSQNESINIADRDYFNQVIENSHVYVSPGFVGRGFGRDLIVAVSTAVPAANDSTKNLGVVEGSFVLTSEKSLKQAINNMSDSVEAVLLDQNDQVLMSSEKLKLLSLSPFKLVPGVSKFYDHDLVNLVDGNGIKSDEVYYIEESVFHWGWKLITLRNEQVHASVIEKSLILFAFSIVLVVLLSYLFAWLISHSWSYYMQKLIQLIDRGEDFEKELIEFEENDELPEEISKLYQEIKRSRLKITNMNQVLQNTVAERTEKLQLLNTKLNVMARQDALTKLDNRRVFNDSLNELWIECQRELIPLSMLIIDLDYFKKVNDTYGHPIGDQVLIYLGKELSQFKTDGVKCIARLGGEEFSMLIKGIEHKESIELAEKIRSHIAGLSISIGTDKFINVTVSIGVASIDATKFTSSKLYQLADNALYEAKHSGRNAVKHLELD
ncbi:diguanylate cyclase [Marinicella litoralis]|uniref:diguanylate cyclase n=2 Tax=Marinicella litoralis TaxID=644220 RepID=A0A4R6XJ42_9GAMM|nr:diguanylate cyclase [Marinicella litoralis]